MTELETQLQPDNRRVFDFDMTGEERTAFVSGLGVIRERLLGDEQLRNSVRAVLDLASRSYAEELVQDKLHFHRDLREALDTRARGILYGFARSADCLTSEADVAELEALFKE